MHFILIYRKDLIMSLITHFNLKLSFKIIYSNNNKLNRCRYQISNNKIIKMSQLLININYTIIS
jgi:hypothetical protein